MGVNDYIQIGNRIKEARRNASMRQKEVAKILNIPISTYSGYENNHREPSTEMLGRIAEVLGVSVDWLIYGKKGFTFSEANKDITLEDAKQMIEKVASAAMRANNIQNDIFALVANQVLNASRETLGENQEEYLLEYYRRLNNYGKFKVCAYANDLTHIDEYTKPDTSDESNS